MIVQEILTELDAQTDALDTQEYLDVLEDLQAEINERIEDTKDALGR